MSLVDQNLVIMWVSVLENKSNNLADAKLFVLSFPGLVTHHLVTQVVSKLLGRLVVRQLMAYLSSADLIPMLQSGFRPGHSTETAVLQVLSELLQAVDRGDFAQVQRFEGNQAVLDGIVQLAIHPLAPGS